MADEKTPAEKPKGPSGSPAQTMGPTPEHAEADKKKADAPDEKTAPKTGKYIKVTALGNNQRVVKGKVYTNEGSILTGADKATVDNLQKDPGLTVEHFEDGQLVDKAARANFFGE